ncbi:uncharacterized protein LOC115213514 isoform X1 [Argonauta hians]
MCHVMFLDCLCAAVLHLLTCITLSNGLPIEPLSTLPDLLYEVQKVSNHTASAVNITFDSYCEKTFFLFGGNCSEVMNKMWGKMNVTFPELKIQENISSSQSELLQMAMLNISTTLSKYEVVLKNQVKREYDSLCAPATRIGVKCYYPAACSQLTPTSDAIFYCYLRHTLSYIVDLRMLTASLPMLKEMNPLQKNIETEDNTSLTENRQFTMLTLYALRGPTKIIRDVLHSYT